MHIRSFNCNCKKPFWRGIFWNDFFTRFVGNISRVKWQEKSELQMLTFFVLTRKYIYIYFINKVMKTLPAPILITLSRVSLVFVDVAVY